MKKGVLIGIIIGAIILVIILILLVIGISIMFIPTEVEKGVVNKTIEEKVLNISCK